MPCPVCGDPTNGNCVCAEGREGDYEHDDEELRELPEDRGWPTQIRRRDDCKAPAGKFRVVLFDGLPALAMGGGKLDGYHHGDYDSLDAAKTRCERKEPEVGTFYLVFDDQGNEYRP